jgi:hypothetical protein
MRANPKAAKGWRGGSGFAESSDRDESALFPTPDDGRGLLREATMTMQRTCTGALRGRPHTKPQATPTVTLFLLCGACAAPMRPVPSGSAAPACFDAGSSHPISAMTATGTSGGAGEPAGPSAGSLDRSVPQDPSALAPAAPAESGYPIHGILTSSYRGRWTSGDHDHDLFETLSLDLGDPARNPWTGHVMTRVDADLDGKHPGEPSIFHDLDDTYDGAIVPRLYDAWMERSDVGSLERVRLGRQTLWDTPVFAWFDGASAETKELGTGRFKIGAYGGVPVHLYESSRSGDLMGGAYAETLPWTGGRARLDAMHVEDEGTLGAHANDLWHLGVSQKVGQELRVDGGYTRLEEADRDVSASMTWCDPDADFTARASYFELLTTQKDLVPELDPYYATLFELFPYRQASALLSKGLGKDLRIQAGVDIRRVAEDGDIGQFNRDFERTFGTVIVQNVLPAKTTASVTGEVWNSSGSDIRTFGLDLSEPFGEKVDASAGTVYSLYKVDQLTGEEQDHVRTYYARVRWRATPSLAWDLRYDLESLDPDPIQSLRVGLAWRF